MLLNIIRQVTIGCRRPSINRTLSRFYSIYEPPYLKAYEPPVPLYPTLNIRIRGYVYSVLEYYQSFITKVANELNIDIDDGYPLPHQELKVKKFKEASTIVNAEYHLRIYERNVVLSNLSSIKCPVFIRILEATLPEGISLHVDEYDPSIERKRYVPDKELLDMKSELDGMKKK